MSMPQYTLMIRTDKPEAELYIYAQDTLLAEHVWEAHRQLAETIHRTIDNLLAAQGLQASQLEAIAAWQGPGSFTGLRIGLSVANAFASAQAIPIVGATGTQWRETALARLAAGDNDGAVLPEYGAPVHITAPRK